MLKFLILLFYYNRPTLVRETLQSVKDSFHTNWHLAFIDDASDYPGEPIVREIFGEEELAKTTFFNIQDTKEEKLARKGSWIGREANAAIHNIPADVSIFLCDDDMLLPDYMTKLDKFYQDCPEIMYSYSWVKTFGNGADGTSWLNKAYPLDPYCQVDASQVTWRNSCFIDGGVKFPTPKTSCLDSDIFGQLCERYGLCQFNGIVGQMKRIHENQLGNHSSLDKVD